MQYIENENFIVSFDETFKSDVTDFVDYLESQIPEILSFFGITTHKKININIYSDRIDFHRKLGRSNVPDWVVGSVPDNEVEILSYKLTESSHSKEDMLKVMIHEFIHALIYNELNKGDLGWFEEGVCIYLSKQIENFNSIYEYYDSKIMDIPSFDQPFDDLIDKGGYLYCGMIIEFYVERFGESKFNQLLEVLITQGLSSMDITNMNFDYQRYIINKYLVK